MDFEKFIERFRERVFATLNDRYGPTEEADISTNDICYIMKADREISVFGVSFEFFFRLELGEVKVISLVLNQLVEFDLEAVFTENATVKQIDDYIYDSMIVLDTDEGRSFLTGGDVQNSISLLRTRYDDLIVYMGEVWDPKTKELKKDDIAPKP